MGIDLNIDLGGLSALYCFKDLFKDIKNEIKVQKEFNIKIIINKLKDFLLSDEYLYIIIFVYKSKEFKKYKENKKIALVNPEITAGLFGICEYFENFSSIKCLFPLIEELKKSKFENQINRLHQLSENKNILEICQKKFYISGYFYGEQEVSTWKKLDNYYLFINQIMEQVLLENIKINAVGGIKDIVDFKKLFKKDELQIILNDLFNLDYPLQYIRDIYILFMIILSYNNNKPTNDDDIIFSYYLYPIFLKIKNIINNRNEFEIKEVINKIAEFYMTDTFIFLSIIKKDFPLLVPLLFISESIGKYLSVKYVLPLIEELKKIKFENQITKINQLLKNEKEKNNFIENFYQNISFEENYNKELKTYINIISNDFITQRIFLEIIFILFPKNFNLIKLDKVEFINNLFLVIKQLKKSFNNFNKELKEEKELLNDLMGLNYPLYYTKEIYQLFILVLNIFLSYEKMENKLDNNIIDELKKAISQNNISENVIYFIYEKNKNLINESSSKYNISFYVKKKSNDKINSIFFYEKMEKNNSIIYKNLFNEEKISEVEFNKLKNDVLFNDKNFNDNGITKEIEVLNEPQELNKINESKACLNELIFEKNKNKELEEELKEKNLKIEKLEKEIINLTKELSNKGNINKDNKDLMTLSKINIYSKDEIVKTLLDKDKEIKLLKEKIQRFPFVLKENEKLISIIFTNSEEEFKYSFICKNTDKFYLLESRLYERLPKYGETVNYFMVNGKRVINHKTLEENHIYDSSIVTLYQDA